MKKKILRTEYSVEVTKKKLLHILDTDRDKRYNDDTLVNRLEAIDGVDSIIYDGHFGAYIYLRIDIEKDNEITWQKILQTIQEY
jgi:hypothetical protein